MPDIWDLIVIGGGASGMTAAIAAACLGEHVLVLEKSSALGRKIAASGNGRCNLMNVSNPIYYGQPAFADQVFRHYSPDDLRYFWDDSGLCLTNDGTGRLYPRTYHSSTVLDTLKSLLKLYHTEIRLQTTVCSCQKAEGLFHTSSDKGSFLSKRVLIATGGPAAPNLGGTMSGHDILRSFGHKIMPLSPALCPLCTDRLSISGLNGIRARCRLRLFKHDQTQIFQTSGEILFTDYGISGICAMQCARFIDQDDYTVLLDLSDGQFNDPHELFNLIAKKRERYHDFPPEILLNGLVLPKLSYAVLKQAGIELRSRKAGQLSNDELHAITEHFLAYRICVHNTRGYEYAQVTRGGADCSEFNPATMESNIMKGLYTSGEVMNIDGTCGGYNLMFAFITGILAGLNGRNKKELYK